jgi:transposase
LKPALTPVLDTIAALTKKIQCLESRIERLASKRYPETGLLRQISGVGPLTSLSFVLTLEDPARFRIPVAGSRGGPQPQPFQRAANRLRRVRASVSWSATPSP